MSAGFFCLWSMKTSGETKIKVLKYKSRYSLFRFPANLIRPDNPRAFFPVSYLQWGCCVAANSNWFHKDRLGRFFRYDKRRLSKCLHTEIQIEYRRRHRDKANHWPNSGSRQAKRWFPARRFAPIGNAAIRYFYFRLSVLSDYKLWTLRNTYQAKVYEIIIHL